MIPFTWQPECQGQTKGLFKQAVSSASSGIVGFHVMEDIVAFVVQVVVGKLPWKLVCNF